MKGKSGPPREPSGAAAAPDRPWRIDLHAHTRRSHDSLTSPVAFVERAARAGLDKVAITDHGTIAGAEEAAALDPDRVIVGVELRCREGVDLIGLFVTREVPDRLPAAELAAAIREQGGVVYAPHPFAYLTRAEERARLAMEVADVVEVFNARAFWRPWNRRALAAARVAGIPGFASSDAHFQWEIGRAWTRIPRFSGPREFLRAARTAVPEGPVLSSPFVHVGSMILGLARGGRIEL